MENDGKQMLVPFNDSSTECTVHLLILIYVIIHITKHLMSFIYILDLIYFIESMYCLLTLGTLVYKQFRTSYLNVNCLCKEIIKRD